MILFFEHGRLGNQLFQYCGLKKHFPTELLIFLGCDDLQAHFDFVQARFIPKSAINHWVSFDRLRRVIIFLTYVRLFSCLREDSRSSRHKLTVRRGLLWNIIIPCNVFFQHRDIVSFVKSEIPFLKQGLRTKAIFWLRDKRIDPELQQVVFVHVRRTDYLHWPSDEFPAVLDLAWYKRAMASVLRNSEQSVFVIMGDDHYYLKDVFQESDSLVISKNPPEVDLAIMSLCRSGILSPSSFAFWGAIYARVQDGAAGQFIAPKYWAGHRQRKWYPAFFCADFIHYSD